MVDRWVTKKLDAFTQRSRNFCNPSSNHPFVRAPHTAGVGMGPFNKFFGGSGRPGGGRRKRKKGPINSLFHTELPA